MPETPLELNQLREYLHGEYMGLIVGTGNKPEDKERNFRSKALAAFAIQKHTGCSKEAAVRAIVDGGGDGGIDAIYFEERTKLLWVVQSKFMNDGHGEPSLGDIGKYKEGLENLLSQTYSAFANNPTFAARIPELQNVFLTGGIKVRSAIVYSGVEENSIEERTRMLEKVRQRFSDGTDYFESFMFNLVAIHEWILPDNASGVDVEMTLHYPAKMPAQPFEMYYGLVTLTDLSNLYSTEGKRLIAGNIREYKGKTAVNDSIKSTLTDVPQHFPYLNNGLTGYCSRLEVVPADRGDQQKKRLRIEGLSIVNGAQTLGSIAGFASGGQAVPHGFAFIKLISLQGSPDFVGFAKAITESTNFQNLVGSRDFASLDIQQRRIADHLALSGITYHYKESADTPDPDEYNFTFDEALVALACHETDLDYCSRLVSNRDSLRSQKDVYDETYKPYTSRYRRVFRLDYSARTVWRSVQAMRVVVAQMKVNTQLSDNPLRRAFYTEARWLVLHLLFVKLHPERGDGLRLTSQEVKRIEEATDLLSATLLDRFEVLVQNTHPKTVLSRTDDCTRLKSATFAELAKQGKM